jgi:hypothetical protein
MNGLDNWITGHYGADHPGNQLCPDCGKDADHHCSICDGCGAPGFIEARYNVCPTCARTCDYCGEESDNITAVEWVNYRGLPRVDRVCPTCAIANDLTKGGA